MSDILVEYYEGCLLCGIRKSEAIADHCEKDKSKDLLVPNFESPHYWTEVKRVDNWYGQGIL